MADATVSIDIVARDLASSVLSGIKGALGGLGDAAALGGLVTATGMLLQFVDSATKSTIAYGEAVQETISITGQSSEVASRMLNLFTLFGISQSEATMAARQFAKDGVEFSLPTLQKLAAGYQALNDPAEKQKYLLDNLGRSGFYYAEMLSQTTTRLDELYNSTNKVLVLNREQQEQLDNYSISVNQLNQNWLAVKVNIGEKVVPVLSTLLEWVNKNWEAVGRLIQTLSYLANPVYFATSQMVAGAGNQESYMGANNQAGAAGAAIGNLLGGGGGGRSEYRRLPGPGRGRASGGPADGRTIVGEMGPEMVDLPYGSYVYPTAGGGGATVIVNYQPMFSAASQTDVERLMPLIESGVNRALRNRR